VSVNVYGQRLATIVSQLTDCLCELLETEGGGPTCWCGFYPGAQPSWDYCGECSGGSCGMGYVSIVSVFPSQTMPDPAVASGCAMELAVTLRVGAMRCVPVADEQGMLPDEGAMLESGLAIMADMGAIHKAVACCIPGAFVGAYVPQGARGGCAGGEWTVTVSLDA
jgi:hypothetical protein